MSVDFVFTDRVYHQFICRTCCPDPVLVDLINQFGPDRSIACCGCDTPHAGSEMLPYELVIKQFEEYLPESFINEVEFDGIERISLAAAVARMLRSDDEVLCKMIALSLESIGETTAGDYFHPGTLYSPSTPDEFENGTFPLDAMIDLGADAFAASAKTFQDIFDFAQEQWEDMRKVLTHGQRFFNGEVEEFFRLLINEALLARLPDSNECPAITAYKPGKKFYRARIANDFARREAITSNPSIELSAPGKLKAANNRMSPSGVPLFYAANNEETALAEVRPSIDDSVVIGAFTSTRDLLFFDFTGLDKELQHGNLSYFDMHRHKRFLNRFMLQLLHRQIAKPTRSTDTDYVVTQALSEYIQYLPKEQFDGIKFQSVQNADGVNYVIFDRSARANVIAVESESVPVATVIARYDHGLTITPKDVTVRKVTEVKFYTDTPYAPAELPGQAPA